MSPWLLGFFIFTLYPVVSSLYYSFTSYPILLSPKWVGLANYKFMFTKDPFFWIAIRNTAWIIIVGVPLRIIIAVATASLLVRPRRGVKVYRTLFFLPTLAAEPEDRTDQHGAVGPRLGASAAVVPEPHMVEARDLDPRPVGRR
jgi:ABC-type sugar transport system permease subunit